ncbi:DUF7342 family protein [Halovenus halobia]|uniref:DUF7342 family protein n=1 Tax=Halovenus halobia TaxID=3396622 RepID=UPI003F562AA6
MPPEFEIAERFEDELADKPADERVYRIALQLHDPGQIAEIADRADCAPDTARRHCERLAEIGVLNRTSDQPATYQRNEAYFESPTPAVNGGACRWTPVLTTKQW